MELGLWSRRKLNGEPERGRPSRDSVGGRLCIVEPARESMLGPREPLESVRLGSPGTVWISTGGMSGVGLTSFLPEGIL